MINGVRSGVQLTDQGTNTSYQGLAAYSDYLHGPVNSVNSTWSLWASDAYWNSPNAIRVFLSAQSWTRNPTRAPSRSPTLIPTSQPTSSPTRHPSSEPTLEPTHQPTLEPTTYSPTYQTDIVHETHDSESEQADTSAGSDDAKYMLSIMALVFGLLFLSTLIVLIFYCIHSRRQKSDEQPAVSDCDQLISTEGDAVNTATIIPVEGGATRSEDMTRSEMLQSDERDCP